MELQRMIRAKTVLFDLEGYKHACTDFYMNNQN